jgi:hypothetical protein
MGDELSRSWLRGLIGLEVVPYVKLAGNREPIGAASSQPSTPEAA